LTDALSREIELSFDLSGKPNNVKARINDVQGRTQTECTVTAPNPPPAGTVQQVEKFPKSVEVAS
jgi:hypothetical protein